MAVETGHPITDPEMDDGIETVARTQVQIVLVFPQALPANTQLLHPEVPTGGSDTKLRFTVGVVVSNGLGFPLKRAPD